MKLKRVDVGNFRDVIEIYRATFEASREVFNTGLQICKSVWFELSMGIIIGMNEHTGL